MHKLIVLSLLLCTVFSCSKEETIVVDTDLQPLFDSFAAEATKRGLTLDMSPYSGTISDLAETNVAAKCQTISNGQKRVLVDQTFWKSASALQREMVVFHELGHCVLNRAHLDDARSDGSCYSMMQSGLGLCKMSYSDKTRSAYLDELFKL
jgi:hypothetical protein